MKEYDIFLPLRYNDGNHVESHKFQDVQEQLLAKFDGLTYVRSTKDIGDSAK